MPDKEMQEARQRLARYRANVNRINSLLRLPLRLRGPSQSVTVKPKDNPGGSASKNYPDALSDLQRLADINTMIAGYVLEITEIEGALSVLGKEERWQYLPSAKRLVIHPGRQFTIFINAHLINLK